MERLTRWENENVVLTDYDYEEMKDKFYRDNDVVDCVNLELALQELADYEDAEEQGLLLRLPCKVGDKVYVLNKIKREIFPSRVEHIEYVVNTNVDFPMTKIKGEGFCVFFDDFSKIVFLTREEAEQALADMQKGK